MEDFSLSLSGQISEHDGYIPSNNRKRKLENPREQNGVGLSETKSVVIIGMDLEERTQSHWGLTGVMSWKMRKKGF